MQLVQQGKLNLDQDVNTYLDFTIPPAFGKPITLRNIMTHTPGFEETIKELLVADAAAMRPLNEYLREHIPARIFPPGVTPAYSNYATAFDHVTWYPTTSAPTASGVRAAAGSPAAGPAARDASRVAASRRAQQALDALFADFRGWW